MSLKQKNNFRDKVFTVVKKIPVGKTLSYKEVASRAGKPRSARAVGAILRTNFDQKIPCHRVIKKGGRLGGYNRGVAEKSRILKCESALVKSNRSKSPLPPL